MASEDDEIMREFLLESRDNLSQLDRDFVALEQNPRDHTVLSRIFRCIHTIKGTCGFLNLPALERLTHSGESQLSRLRDGEILLDAHATSTLLAMVDGVRRVLDSLERGAGEGNEDFSPIIAELAKIGQTEGSSKAASLPAAPASSVASQGPRSQRPPASLRPVPAEPAKAAAETPVEAAPRALNVGDTTVRVDVALLDRIMNLVGELVLARNQILKFGTKSLDAGLVAASQRLNLLTTELQAGVMKTRMQPIGNVWNRFPRVVRDVASVCGKKVNLEVEGADTELDRSVIEAIWEPLIHAVRNAIDHGIETPERRRLAGKSPTGRLLLRAYHEGGQVNIEVSDDGAGINTDKVRARSVERGLVSAERAARMNEREVAHLIFLPGFSTADSVTTMSGRGVGMDVVKTNIEEIGGTVDIATRAGLGTTLKIKIPLTLAIIPALIVTSGGERFAIPQVNLLELVRLEGASSRRGIETLHGAPLYRLRGNLLPLVFLNEALELPGPGKSDVVNIVVLQADDRQFGIVVDGISDTEEIVVKPLGKELKALNVFAGATIMGDGGVALILDVLGLAQHTGMVSATRERAVVEPSTAARDESEAREHLLVFRVGSASRVATPLSRVARIEEIAPERIERAGGRDVVQYRGTILPLVWLEQEHLGEAPLMSAEPLVVIVCSEGERSVGLVVEEILDVVEEVVSVESPASSRSTLGLLSVQGRVTELLDVPALFRRHEPGFLARKEVAA
ncbi:MAG TPA: chemotaxis protein CheW [Polyangiaceae bacterium]|nr:chemotaxis protein CheW [Polyangiaceae bacterium]